jgi:hypothetical protein
MATSPSFIGTPVIGTAALSAANTALDGSGTIVSLLTGAASGTRVLEIDAQCSATSSACLVNIFLSSDSGTSWTLFDQITITAITVSTTAKAFRNYNTYANLILPSTSYKLGVTATVAQAIKVHALGGNF